MSIRSDANDRRITAISRRSLRLEICP
jgi:hypothetical protein